MDKAVARRLARKTANEVPWVGMDKTRRQEHAKLLKKGEQNLTKTKYLWLTNMDHLSEESAKKINHLKTSDLAVSKAWYLKELFRHFWNHRDRTYAKHYFEFLLCEVKKAGISSMNKIARMLKKHMGNILTYFETYLTNAYLEGINAKIQALKANARGFRNFGNYRTRILFFCGKLKLSP